MTLRLYKHRVKYFKTLLRKVIQAKAIAKRSQRRTRPANEWNNWLRSFWHWLANSQLSEWRLFPTQWAKVKYIGSLWGSQGEYLKQRNRRAEWRINPLPIGNPFLSRPWRQRECNQYIGFSHTCCKQPITVTPPRPCQLQGESHWGYQSVSIIHVKVV